MRIPLVLSIKTLVVLFATIAIFYQDLAILVNEALRSEMASYIIAIPFLFVYLLYRKRKMLRAVISLESADRSKKTKHLATIAGILVSMISILIYWYGSYTFSPLEYHMISLPVFVAGLTLIFFNPQTLRQLAFPIAFLIFLMPPPSVLLYSLGATLSVVSAEVSNAVINALGISSVLSSQYGNPIIQITRSNGTTVPFTVDIACSGVYSLIGFLVFAVFIVYIIRDKLWKRAIIFPIGLLLIYLLNIMRITVILLIGYHYGEEAALQMFHLLGGWTLIFLGTMLLLTIVERMLGVRIFQRTTASTQCQHYLKPSNNLQNSCASCGRLLRYPEMQVKRQDVSKIVAIIMTVILLISIQAPVFALTQGPAEVILHAPTGEQATTQILPQITGYTSRFVYRDRDFEQYAKQDASLTYAYVPNDKTKETIWTTLEIASTRSPLHGWERCLVTWPLTHGREPKIIQLDLRDIQILENPPIIARYFAFHYIETNRTQVVLYWYEQTAFQINATSQQKHVKISVIAYLNSSETVFRTEKQLVTIATAVAQYWQPIKIWMPVAILISENGDKLTAITTVLLIMVTALYAFERREKRKTNANIYRKLSKPVKQIVDVVHETEKTSTTTLNNIAIAYQNLIGRCVNKEKLLHELSEIEKTGIIKRVIISRNDEPTLVWNTQLTFKQYMHTH